MMICHFQFALESLFLFLFLFLSLSLSLLPLLTHLLSLSLSLSRLAAGQSTDSWGIHCAMRAGLEPRIIERANHIASVYSRSLPIEAILSPSERHAIFKVEASSAILNRLYEFDGSLSALEEFKRFVLSAGL